MPTLGPKRSKSWSSASSKFDNTCAIANVFAWAITRTLRVPTGFCSATDNRRREPATHLFPLDLCGGPNGRLVPCVPLRVVDRPPNCESDPSDSICLRCAAISPKDFSKRTGFEKGMFTKRVPECLPPIGTEELAYYRAYAEMLSSRGVANFKEMLVTPGCTAAIAGTCN